MLRDMSLAEQGRYDQNRKRPEQNDRRTSIALKGLPLNSSAKSPASSWLLNFSRPMARFGDVSLAMIGSKKSPKPCYSSRVPDNAQMSKSFVGGRDECQEVRGGHPRRNGQDRKHRAVFNGFDAFRALSSSAEYVNRAFGQRRRTPHYRMRAFRQLFFEARQDRSCDMLCQ